jgi:uncharacterized protein YggE
MKMKSKALGFSILWVGLITVGMAGGAAAQAPGTIRVHGSGEVEVMPDEASIAFAVETFAATAEEAGRENAEVMDRVISALMAAGVPREDIETRNYSLRPEYVHDQQRDEPRIRGYRASNQVILTTRNLDSVGEFIDVALGAGANRMDQVSFGLSDDREARAAALRDAVSNARTSAEAIASSLSVTLGAVMDASTTAMPEPRQVAYSMRMESADMAMAAPTPIQPGEQTVRAQVFLVYSIGAR